MLCQSIDVIVALATAVFAFLVYATKKTHTPRAILLILAVIFFNLVLDYVWVVWAANTIHNDSFRFYIPAAAAAVVLLVALVNNVIEFLLVDAIVFMALQGTPGILALCLSLASGPALWVVTRLMPFLHDILMVLIVTVLSVFVIIISGAGVAQNAGGGTVVSLSPNCTNGKVNAALICQTDCSFVASGTWVVDYTWLWIVAGALVLFRLLRIALRDKHAQPQQQQQRNDEGIELQPEPPKPKPLARAAGASALGLKIVLQQDAAEEDEEEEDEDDAAITGAG